MGQILVLNVQAVRAVICLPHSLGQHSLRGGRHPYAAAVPKLPLVFLQLPPESSVGPDEGSGLQNLLVRLQQRESSSLYEEGHDKSGRPAPACSAAHQRGATVVLLDLLRHAVKILTQWCMRLIPDGDVNKLHTCSLREQQLLSGENQESDPSAGECGRVHGLHTAQVQPGRDLGDGHGVEKHLHKRH